jgi:LemA protein
MSPTSWIIIAVVALLVLIFVVMYNSFVRLRNEVKNSLAQIDVQLKRRSDLIPNLVETVKGYARHEKQLFENVTAARAAMLGANTVAEKGKASNQLSATLKSLFAVAENYPTLKADANFRQLQEELTGTEDKIAFSRQYYNDRVMEFNTKLESFPSNVIGKTFGFGRFESFEAAPSERENVAVKF